MASLMELVDRVNKGEAVDAEQLEIYQESANSAEKFLAHHAHAMLDLRRGQQHMLQSLEAIDYSDQKVLNQFISISQFLGLTDMRAQPVTKFGACAIGRREYALGLEAIQNGVAYDLANGGSYTSDKENCQFIATQYDRAAQWIGWNPDGANLNWNNQQLSVAYVVSGIGDDDWTGRSLRSLAKFHDGKRFKLQVFSTEAGVRRDKQQFAQSSYVTASSKRGRETLDSLTRFQLPFWIAPTDGDTVSAAKDLATQLIRNKIDVVIFDATQADAIAAVVASWEVARVKMNLCRRTPLYSSGISCVTYLDQVRYEADADFWQRKGIETRFILEGIDTEEANSAAPQRSAYGIPDQAVVLATASNELDKTMTEEFCETTINILRAHPHAIYLLIGEGELAWQKRKFESAGVSKRVGYAGKRKDLPGFLRIADLYLAEFPTGSAQGVLQAMAVERAVVAMNCGDDVEHSQAATFAGSEAVVAGTDSAAYIERVSKIIREPNYRKMLGKAMRARVEQHFGFGQTVRHLEQLCDQLIQRSTEASVDQSTFSDSDEAIAEVA